MAASTIEQQRGALALACAALQAYVDKDRAAIEALLADDYRFTSPLDNGLDRATYFERCWPNSAHLAAFAIVERVELGEHAVLVYEARGSDGKRFRNCELFTARDGRLVATEVYFGWDLPHKAPLGSYLDAEQQPAQ